MGYEASEVQQKTCYDVLEGRGALGTTVCHENCSVRQCVGKQEEIPNFRIYAPLRILLQRLRAVSTLLNDNP